MIGHGSAIKWWYNVSRIGGYGVYGREGHYWQTKNSQWIFLNFIYIVLWDVPKIYVLDIPKYSFIILYSDN
jgi:hypothetical protein